MVLIRRTPLASQQEPSSLQNLPVTIASFKASVRLIKHPQPKPTLQTTRAPWACVGETSWHCSRTKVRRGFRSQLVMFLRHWPVVSRSGVAVVANVSKPVVWRGFSSNPVDSVHQRRISFNRSYFQAPPFSDLSTAPSRLSSATSSSSKLSGVLPRKFFLQTMSATTRANRQAVGRLRLTAYKLPPRRGRPHHDPKSLTGVLSIQERARECTRGGAQCP